VALVDRFRVDHPEVVLLDNPARIQSAGLNAAVRRYGRDADVLVRCDAHSVYPDGYCRLLVESLQRTGADAIVVPLDSIGAETCWHKAVARVSNSPIGTGGSAHRAGRKSGFVDHGHHAAFRLETFARAGGYDESFTHNEDAELDCRQRSLGARIYLDSDIRVGYEPRSSVAALWRQYVAYGAGRSRTIRRHHHSARLRQLAVPGHLILSLVALAFGPWFPVLLAWPASYLAVLMGASLWFSVRQRSACFLWSGVAAAVMHVAWAGGFLRALVTSRERTWSPQRVVPLIPGGADQG
jgi:succinoglycan biosynthesis protein ExoA